MNSAPFVACRSVQITSPLAYSPAAGTLTRLPAGLPHLRQVGMGVEFALVDGDEPESGIGGSPFSPLGQRVPG